MQFNIQTISIKTNNYLDALVSINIFLNLLLFKFWIKRSKITDFLKIPSLVFSSNKEDDVQITSNHKHDLVVLIMLN